MTTTHGRRLFSPAQQHPSGLKTVPKTRVASSPPAPPLDAKLELEASKNRTLTLLAERTLLLQRIALIDRQLEAERNSKRRALTAQYERELRALDEEADDLAGPAADAIRLGRGAGLDVRRHPVVGGADHVDIDHLDIDVVLNHIDTDGDGIVTAAEVQGASTGAVVMHMGALIGPLVLGCLAGVLCYAACRGLARQMRTANKPSAGELRARQVMGAKLATPASGGGVSNGGNAPLSGEARMRRKHGEQALRKQECGPAIAC